MKKIKKLFMFFISVIFFQNSWAENKNQTEQVEVDPQVEETLKLIQDGDNNLVLKSTYRDLVLIAGSQGVGKMTLAKLVTGSGDLESYWTGDRYLIRDKSDGQKSPFPQLYIDPVTNTAVYDLPSFDFEPQNNSIEIIHKLFLHKVTAHAQKLKIIFLVNYNSVRSGESLREFTNFLEHATTWIKNPAQFRNSVALIATKVETTMKGQRVVDGIGSFLLGVQKGPPLFQDQGTWNNSIEIINNFLMSRSQQPGKSNLSQIGYFRLPQDEGPLTSLPEIVEVKSVILEIISNLKFVQVTSNDFHSLPLSDSSESILTQVEQTMRQEVTQYLRALRSHVTNEIEIGGNFENLNEQYEILNNFIHSLEESAGINFFEILESFKINFENTQNFKKFKLTRILIGLSTTILNLNDCQTLFHVDSPNNLNWTGILSPLKKIDDYFNGELNQLKSGQLNLTLVESKSFSWIGFENELLTIVLVSSGSLVKKGVVKVVGHLMEKKKQEIKLKATGQSQSQGHQNKFFDSLDTEPDTRPKEGQVRQPVNDLDNDKNSKLSPKKSNGFWKLAKAKLRLTRKG